MVMPSTKSAGGAALRCASGKSDKTDEIDDLQSIGMMIKYSNSKRVVGIEYSSGSLFARSLHAGQS